MRQKRYLDIGLGEGVEPILLQLNSLRRSMNADDSPRRAIVEEMVETIFGASKHLAVYGSLAPGERNHSVIADISGEWSEGYVWGELHQRGWGAGLGYPAIRLDPQPERVPVKLLMSEQLPAHWERLDRFEGDDYQRSLVSVYDGSGHITVANIYEIRSEAAKI